MAKSGSVRLLDDPAIREEALRLALNASNSGLWVWDLKTDRLEWSPEVFAIFEVDDFRPTLENFLSLVHPDDVSRGEEAFARALADGSVLHFEFRRPTRNGDVKWLKNVGRARYDAKGTALQFVGTVCEITGPEDALFDSAASPPETGRGAPRWALDRLKRLQRDLSGHSAADTIGRAKIERDILEFLLCSVITRPEAKKVAGALFQRFASVAEIMEAPREALTAVDGVDGRHLLLIDVARLAIQCMLQPTREPMRFSNETAIVNYLRIAQAYKSKEQLRVLFLDRSRHIIGDEVMQEGTVDYTPVYVREIVKRALELSATSIILAHNHPSGDPTPSSKDIVTTLKIVEVAASLGIAVDDHIILSKHGHTSMRAMKIIQEPEVE